MINLKNLTIKKAYKSLKDGEFTSMELTEAYLSEIEKKNPELFAYLEVFDDVREKAKLADKKISSGEQTYLTGIPLGIKDNILIEGKKASSASKMLENYTATYSSHVSEILNKEGAIILGRTNMDEFAMGSSTETSAFGNTKNPLDISRVPGGSSGGSAVSVAAEMSLFALGSDTAGSVRQPASYCGIVGLKPTYGAVSRYGLMACASSLDVIGPLTRTVEDSEIIFNIINKYDKRDSTFIKEGEREKFKSKNKKIIGIPRDFLEMEGIDKEVLENFNLNIKKLEKNEYKIVDIKLPSFKFALAVYYIIQPAEVSSNFARYDGVRYGLREEGEKILDTYIDTRNKGFGKEVKRRIMLGTYVLSSGYYDAYYYKAKEIQKLIKKETRNIFKDIDIIATPTTPTVAFKFGENNDPLSMYMADIFTVPANIIGIPAISIPSGLNENGMPFGIQFMAPHFNEDKLFSLGKDFENL